MNVFRKLYIESIAHTLHKAAYTYTVYSVWYAYSWFVLCVFAIISSFRVDPCDKTCIFHHCFTDTVIIVLKVPIKTKTDDYKKNTSQITKHNKTKECGNCAHNLCPFRFVAILVCGRLGLWPFWYVAFRFVAVLVCGLFGSWPFRSVAVSIVAVWVCGHHDLLPSVPVS